jgi:hypothetical protein
MNDDLELCEVLEWVNRPNFTHASSFRCYWWGKAISHACKFGLSVTRFCPPLILWYVAAGCAGCGFVDLSMTCQAGRTIWFLGCRAALASRLLRLMLSFDYQKTCLLFLISKFKIKMIIWQTVWGLFSKFIPLVFEDFMLDCLDLSNQVLSAFFSLFGGFNNTLKINATMHRV